MQDFRFDGRTLGIKAKKINKKKGKRILYGIFCIFFFRFSRITANCLTLSRPDATIGADLTVAATQAGLPWRQLNLSFFFRI